MNGYFVSIVPQFLDVSVVGVFVAQEKCGLNGTAVGIGPIGCEYLLIDLPILVIDGVIESQNNQLWRLFGFQTPRYLCSIVTAEAIGKSAVIGITSVGSIRVMLGVTPRLIRPIGAVCLTLKDRYEKHFQ